MIKNKKIWKGKLSQMPTNEIYLNVNALEDGWYQIKIIFKNKVIKELTFKK